MKPSRLTYSFLFLLIILTGLPNFVLAASSNLEVSGWIPYWRVTEGTKDAKSHLDDLTRIYPFGYSVKQDGTLSDTADLNRKEWQGLFKAARSKDVDIVPTVMWSDSANIDLVLGDTKLREKHIKAITDMVKKNKFAGVDIDYEGKFAQTKDNFSLFLKELKKSLGNKMLVCTVEARTPPDSLYRVMPSDLSYANDYVAIGQVCDRVQLMVYDQRRVDLSLDAANLGTPYSPVADINWARKVINLALQSIPRNKLVIGVPTYGYEYQVIVSPNWYQDYLKLWSFNPGYALPTAKAYGITPERNSAGELSFSYLATTSPKVIPDFIQAPAGTPSGNIAAVRALAYANLTNLPTIFNLVWWSDAKAIEDKVKLARELGLAGVAIFKIDGGEDKNLWKIFDDK